MKTVVDGLDSIKISQGLGLGDFDLIRVIGRGSYAKVLLVRLKKNDQIYAMKVVKKELVHDDEVREYNTALFLVLGLKGSDYCLCRVGTIIFLATRWSC